MARRIPKVVVIGPAYIDIAIKCDEMPGKGESVRGTGFSYVPGGAGVNCSIQSALCGCDTYFLGKVGDDISGRFILGELEERGVNTEYSFKAPAMSTGAIVTMVNSKGENSSCISQGANRSLNSDEVKSATSEQLIGQADACLICTGVPVETACAVIKLCKVYETKIVMQNTVTARKVEEINDLDWPGEFYMVDALLPDFENTPITEPAVGNSHDLKFVASEFVARGIKTVLIKINSRGSFIIDKNGVTHVEGFEYELVDAGASGDAYAGAYAACLACVDGVKDGVRFAMAAESIAAGRFGTFDALPSKEEIIELLQREGD